MHRKGKKRERGEGGRKKKEKREKKKRRGREKGRKEKKKRRKEKKKRRKEKRRGGKKKEERKKKRREERERRLKQSAPRRQSGPTEGDACAAVTRQMGAAHWRGATKHRRATPTWFSFFSFYFFGYGQVVAGAQAEKKSQKYFSDFF